MAFNYNVVSSQNHRLRLKIWPRIYNIQKKNINVKQARNCKHHRAAANWQWAILTCLISSLSFSLFCHPVMYLTTILCLNFKANKVSSVLHYRNTVTMILSAIINISRNYVISTELNQPADHDRKSSHDLLMWGRLLLSGISSMSVSSAVVVWLYSSHSS